MKRDTDPKHSIESTTGRLKREKVKVLPWFHDSSEQRNKQENSATQLNKHS